MNLNIVNFFKMIEKYVHNVRVKQVTIQIDILEVYESLVLIKKRKNPTQLDNFLFRFLKLICQMFILYHKKISIFRAKCRPDLKSDRLKLPRKIPQSNFHLEI